MTASTSPSIFPGSTRRGPHAHDPRVLRQERHRAALRRSGGRRSIASTSASPRRAAPNTNTTCWCSPPARARSCRRFRAATGPACSSIAPSKISKRSREAGKNSTRGVVIGGGLLGPRSREGAQGSGPRHQRGRVRTQAHGRAGGRGRRRTAALAHRGARRRRAHRQEHRRASTTANPRAIACTSPTAARSKPTSW